MLRKKANWAFFCFVFCLFACFHVHFLFPQLTKERIPWTNILLHSKLCPGQELSQPSNACAPESSACPLASSSSSLQLSASADPKRQLCWLKQQGSCHHVRYLDWVPYFELFSHTHTQINAFLKIMMTSVRCMYLGSRYIKHFTHPIPKITIFIKLTKMILTYFTNSRFIYPN